MHRLRRKKGQNFKEKGKMIRRANHGIRPGRGKRKNRFARGKG
jgi:hypothetical protein